MSTGQQPQILYLRIKLKCSKPGDTFNMKPTNGDGAIVCDTLKLLENFNCKSLYVGKKQLLISGSTTNTKKKQESSFVIGVRSDANKGRGQFHIKLTPQAAQANSAVGESSIASMMQVEASDYTVPHGEIDAINLNNKKNISSPQQTDFTPNLDFYLTFNHSTSAIVAKTVELRNQRIP